MENLSIFNYLKPEATITYISEISKITDNIIGYSTDFQ